MSNADSTKKDTTKFSTFKDLPLKAERSIQFNTQEGTWMSLDVSPDGNTLAFDMMGDIYTLPISGGKAKQITKGLAFDAHPRFSPDGKKILLHRTAPEQITSGSLTCKPMTLFR